MYGGIYYEEFAHPIPTEASRHQRRFAAEEMNLMPTYMLGQGQGTFMPVQGQGHGGFMPGNFPPVQGGQGNFQGMPVQSNYPPGQGQFVPLQPPRHFLPRHGPGNFLLGPGERNFLPGQAPMHQLRLTAEIISDIKSQGLFDQFRRECVSDADMKPAYRNLRQRVEASVMNFLSEIKFTEDLNKIHIREQLRKHINDSSVLESGVERIVDQVVVSKINTVFRYKVEEVIYKHLGIEKPVTATMVPEQQDEPKDKDLLPKDLEAVSSDSSSDHQSQNRSDVIQKDPAETNNDLSTAIVEVETEGSTELEIDIPPTQDNAKNVKLSLREVDYSSSDVSGFSGLDSHDDSDHSFYTKPNRKIGISEDTNMSGPEKEGKDKNKNSTERKSNSKTTNDKHKSSKSHNQRKDDKDKSKSQHKSEKSDNKDKSDKHKSDNKDKTVLKHSSQNKDRKHSESSKSSKKDGKEREKSRDKADQKPKENRDKSDKKSEKVHKPTEKSDKKKIQKEREPSIKDKKIPVKDKESHVKEKESSEKSKSSKEKSTKDKEKADKDKSREREKHHKSKSVDKDKHDKERSSSTKHRSTSSSSNKETNDNKNSSKEKSSSSKSRESSHKDKHSSKSHHKHHSSDKSKDRSKSSSSSKDKEKKGGGDSKSSDKAKKNDINKSNKKEQKKVTDDHYSFKDKNYDRRSTDRDSNDDSSANNKLRGRFLNLQKVKKETDVFSSGGTGTDSTSNSDKVEQETTIKKEEPITSLAYNLKQLKQEPTEKQDDSSTGFNYNPDNVGEKTTNIIEVSGILNSTEIEMTIKDKLTDSSLLSAPEPEAIHFEIPTMELLGLQAEFAEEGPYFSGFTIDDIKRAAEAVEELENKSEVKQNANDSDPVYYFDEPNDSEAKLRLYRENIAKHKKAIEELEAMIQAEVNTREIVVESQENQAEASSLDSTDMQVVESQENQAEASSLDSTDMQVMDQEAAQVVTQIEIGRKQKLSETENNNTITHSYGKGLKRRRSRGDQNRDENNVRNGNTKLLSNKTAKTTKTEHVPTKLHKIVDLASHNGELQLNVYPKNDVEDVRVVPSLSDDSELDPNKKAATNGFKKPEGAPPVKRQKVSKGANQRYSNDDLFKPRPVLRSTSSRRRSLAGRPN